MPGPQESDEDEEGDKSPKTKNKENNLNVVNSGPAPISCCMLL